MSRDLENQALDFLLDSGVLVETGDSFELTPAFRRRRQEREEEISSMSSKSVDDELAAYDGVIPADRRTRRTLATLRALESMGEPPDEQTVVVASLSLDLFDDPPATGGVPEGFTPVRGSDIERFLVIHPTAVIYIWREECDPCDEVRRRLEDLLASGKVPAEVGLGAVYGPEWAEMLFEEYSVGGAPTLLFVDDGEVDSRLLGEHDREVIEREIAIIAGS